MKKWLPFMIVAGIVLGVLSYWFHTRTYGAAEVVQMLPPDRASHIYVNIDMLRSAGLLDQIAGSAALESDEYRAFINASGFNYRTDLDAVAIAFRDDDNYFVAQGRFDWPKIEAYVQVSGGACVDAQCSVPSTVPGRTVTFYMPRGDIMAIASSHGQPANAMIAPGSWEKTPQIPSDAVMWASAPPFTFTDLEEELPGGTRSFITPLRDAIGTIFTLGPSEDFQSFVLRMEVEWEDEAKAKAAAADLTEDTELLNSMIRRENMTPNPADMSGVLTRGEFTADGTKMIGTWPLERVLFDTYFGEN